ncbi:hypothetical protein BH18ACT13_BH18ACT13_06770 [soil metagenome]
MVARLRSGRAPTTRSATLPDVVDVFTHRLLVLAGVALLAGLIALAALERRSQEDGAATLASATAPASWNTAFAGSRGKTGDAQRTTCGQVLAAAALGVTHPVLPCGAKIVLRNGEKAVLSEIVDNALVQPGRQLEVTQALARMLGLEGTAEIEWRFATEATG